MRKQIRDIMEGENEAYQTAQHPTLFHELLNSDLSPDERSLSRLEDEGLTVVGAGQITTAHFLALTSYHILANPEILQKLKTELESAIPNPEDMIPLQQLEQLPHLSAIVTEGLRLSYGNSHRNQRVSPHAPLIFRNWVIPAGTPVSMSIMDLHDNAELFPEPDQFQPQRWLEGGKGKEERLDKYIVNFGRGSRSCLGMNLANAEIYLTLAAVFRRFDMQLYETERDEVDIAHDFFVPCPKLDAKGVRVVLKCRS